MNRLTRLIIPAAIAFLIIAVALPAPAFCAEFSADLVISGDGMEQMAKVFVNGKLQRIDIMKNGELIGTSISRPDKGVNWNIMPSEKMYIEVPYTSIGPQDMESWESKGKMTVLGKETVNGFKCEKRRYDSNDKTEGSVIVWYSPKLEHMVKMHVLAVNGEEEMFIQYKNIKMGNLSDETFMVDSTYQKLTMPAGMPSGMPGGMSPGGMPGFPGMGR